MNTTTGTTIYCSQCLCFHSIDWNHQPTEETVEEGEKVELRDPSLGILEEMRAGRDKAVRLAQTENDRASLLEFEAKLRRSKAQMILREVNEARTVGDDL